MPVDDAHVGPVELLPEEPRRPERLDRLLELRAELLEARADARGKLRETALDAFAGVPEARIEPHAVEVARQCTDVRRYRHPVVVEHDHERRAEPARLMDRLEGDAARHRAVSDDRADPARVRRAGQPHALLEPDPVADRSRRVPGAHDVVRALLDAAERREPLVLADRRELVAAPCQHLVRIGLMADVPEDLVARGVQQRVQRDRKLAGAEVRAEVPADLTDGVDDVLAHLLRDLLELLLVREWRSCGASMRSRRRLIGGVLRAAGACGFSSCARR